MPESPPEPALERLRSVTVGTDEPRIILQGLLQCSAVFIVNCNRKSMWARLTQLLLVLFLLSM